MPPFDWQVALEHLLPDHDPGAWTRYYPNAGRAPFRNDVAVAAPGIYLFYDTRARAWTILWASCSYAATEVFGVAVNPAQPNVFFPPLPAQVVGLSAPPISMPRLLAATQGRPAMPGSVARPNQPPFQTLAEPSRISYFFGNQGPEENAVAILFRGSPQAAPC